MKGELRLLACSDLHGSERALEMLSRAASEDEYDAVVICGDFTTYGSQDFVKKCLGTFDVKVLAVPGNCDTPDTVDTLERADASVHNARVSLKGQEFFGFGGGAPTSAQMPFEVDEDLMERSLRAVAVPEGIMVTHMPSYGMNDKGRLGGNSGSRALLRIAKEFKPVLALSGHIHEARGRKLTAETVFVNPGAAKNGHYASIVVGDEVKVDLRDGFQHRDNPTTF